MPDELARWAAERAPGLLSRAEADAIVLLRDALVKAALHRGQEAAPATLSQSNVFKYASEQSSNL